MWVASNNRSDIIKSAWSCNRGQIDLHGVLGKIKNYSKFIDDWNRKTFGSVKKNLNHARHTLKILQLADPYVARIQEQN